MFIALIIIIAFCIGGAILSILGPCLEPRSRKKPKPMNPIKPHKIAASPSSKRPISADQLDLFLYVYGLDFIPSQAFNEYPHLNTLEYTKIFELCYVASVYIFYVGNPKHPQRSHVIQLMQGNKTAFAEFRQLDAFMFINYNAKVISDIVATQGCSKEVALVLGITNWLLLELIGNHQPWEVVPLSERISKLLLGLTFNDLIEKQMRILLQMKGEGLSLAEIKEFLINGRILGLSHMRRASPTPFAP